MPRFFCVIVGFEREVARVQIANQQTLAFEVATHALADGTHEGFELGLVGCLHALDAESVVGGDIHTIQHQDVKVDIDVERAAEALDEGDRAGAGGAYIPSCVADVSPACGRRSPTPGP